MSTVTKCYCIDKRKLILSDKPTLPSLFATITERVFPGVADSPSPVYLFDHILCVLLSYLGWVSVLSTDNSASRSDQVRKGSVASPDLSWLSLRVMFWLPIQSPVCQDYSLSCSLSFCHGSHTAGAFPTQPRSSLLWRKFWRSGCLLDAILKGPLPRFALKLEHDLCTSLDWLKFTLCVQENTDTPGYKFQLYQVPAVTSDDLSFPGFVPLTHRKRTHLRSLLTWEIIW